MSSVKDVCQAIADREAEYVEILGEVVAIRSVSTWLDHRQETERMAAWLRDRIVALGGTCRMRHPPKTQTLPDGTAIKMAPVLLGVIGEDPAKKTLLLYGHYDVQPATKEDGWDTDPWTLTRMPNGELRGRGSTDDKGPVVGWLNTIAAFQSLKMEVPVNIRFVMEGMEESGSEGFDDTMAELKAEDDPIFKGVDFCCISDNYWLGNNKPCLTHGLRGIISVSMTIEGPSQDLHSGIYGGQTYEVMDDLTSMFSMLKTCNGDIAIPGIAEQVAPLTEDEKENYKAIEFDLNTRKTEIGVKKLRYEEDKARCLQAVWRYPSLSIHGVEGAFYQSGFKTVIPKKVIGKFSIRCVPDMNMNGTTESVKAWLTKQFATLNSPNTFSVHCDSGTWWYASPSSPVFKAAERAITTVFGVRPDITREGGSIPVTVILSELTGKDLCLIPMGRSNDGAHSQNEKLDISNYIKGMQVYAEFMQELSEIKA